MHQAYPYCTSLWCLRIEEHHPVSPGSVGHSNITNTVHQANLYCTSLWCLRIEKHHPLPPGSVGHLNITNTVHQANPYCTSSYCSRIEKHHSVPSGAVLVSNSTTQFHLVQSSYRIAPLSFIWCCPHTKLVFPSTKFWTIRPSCTTYVGILFCHFYYLYCT